MSEVTELLSRLIRARSINPPGDESAAADVLTSYLRAADVPVQRYVAAPARVNVVARSPGVAAGPSLLLLSHLDTVDATPAEWTHDPWGGEIADGCVWGRGALDLKGQAAAQAVAVASLRRDGIRLRGDVVLAATADEETGSALGSRWLLEHHPEVLRTDYAITHGAGDRVVADDRVMYFCANGERRRAHAVVTFTAPASLSILAQSSNALVAASAFIAKVAGQHAIGEPLPAVADAIRELSPGGDSGRLLDRIAELPDALRTLLTPMTGATVIPTAMEASCVPGAASSCTVALDCWLLPGRSDREVQDWLLAVAGTGAELTWTPGVGGTESAPDTDLWRAIEHFLADVEGSAELLSLCDAGMTDAHWLRERHGTVVYGFYPMREMTTDVAARCVHGPDERMPVRDLDLQTEFYRHIVREVCG